jgi:hypothetical protein
MFAPKLSRAYVSAFRSVLTSVYLLILKFTDPGFENLMRKGILSTKTQISCPESSGKLEDYAQIYP